MEEEKSGDGLEKKYGRSRRKQAEPKKTGSRLKIFGTACALAVLVTAAGGAFYYIEMGKYTTAFFPNTTINGIKASGMTVEEVKEEIERGLSDYTLTIAERDGEEIITKEEIGLHSEFDGSLEELLASQNPEEWGKYLGTARDISVETLLVYDEELLDQKIQSLACMDRKKMREPENASISEYQSDTKSYSVLPAVPGTEVIGENVKKAVENAVKNLETRVDLDAEGCYTKAAVEADDEGLLSLTAELNRYVGAVVNHTFGDTVEVLDGDRIHEWLSVDGQTVVLDESQAAAYVKELASKYNTAYKEKKLKTTYGPEVTISKGNYGWRINEAKETEAVLSIIRAGEQKTREPEYLQKGASHGEQDYGNTYVEINLTAQHLYFYKDGELVVESDFVSGNQSRGWSTPAGAYPITYKQRNATLRGQGYTTPVSYWMPFNGGIGLHDANWRGSFGGKIYKTNGSHGCVNLPPSAAKKIYETISAGDPVLCYYLEGTESQTTSRKSGTSRPSSTEAPGTAAPATEPVSEPAQEPTPSAAEPVGPSVPAETQASEPTVSAETRVSEPAAPVETEPTEPAVPIETRPVNSEGTTEPAPSVTGEPVPSVTAGNDDTGFGPGFVRQEEETTKPEIGPGY